MVSVESRTQSEGSTGSKTSSMEAPPAVIHFEMGGMNESPTNWSKNTKDDATSKDLSNNIKGKPKKMDWKEVDVPSWLQELKSYNDGDWKVLVNRQNGRNDWKYIHQRYKKTFRSAPGVRFFLDGKEMNQVFKEEKLRKRKENDTNSEASGPSKPKGGRKAADTRTRALTIGNPVQYVPEKLPVGFI
ncbi:uncharacterized protein LOC123440822 [Hordeum vulgare subsp. vulgare]|uniref:Uncharacterized protein n=1 Tax=Hordeum vulgare subsp. vulgare TaxID=112509 RepID=A0A8I6Y6E1_HORVV|nr:uncharacterized protein LOC123440822 [Hordeum vulgare subsp. vulgare]